MHVLERQLTRLIARQARRLEQPHVSRRARAVSVWSSRKYVHDGVEVRLAQRLPFDLRCLWDLDASEHVEFALTGDPQVPLLRDPSAERLQISGRVLCGERPATTNDLDPAVGPLYRQRIREAGAPGER